MLSSRQVRAARGAVAASVATFVALMSHLLGGGEIPGLLGIVVPWLLSLPVCMMLAGRRLSLWRLSISVAVSQVLFHVLFVLGTPSTDGPMVASHAGHGARGIETMPMPVTGDASVHTAAIHADPIMWVWHGIAAVVTIAALYRGEQTLSRLRDLASQTVAWVRRRLATTVLPPALSSPTERLVSAIWSTASLSDGVELAPLRRRGPPLLHAL